MILTTDEEGTVQYLSSATFDVVGYAPQKGIGRSIFELIHPEDKLSVQQMFERVIESQIHEKIEYRYRHARGDYVWLESAGQSMVDPKGLSRRFVCSVRDITNRKKMETELKKSRDESRMFAACLDKIREEERAKVALEIHDELGQHMTAMKMGLAWLQNKLPANEDGLQEMAKTLTKDADAAVKMIRRISSGLRPPILDDVGLEAAMEWQTRDFQNRTRILCRFKSSCNRLNLSGERATAVFRIAQESLTNVARHSGATRVLIDIREKDGRMILKIRDHGRGIGEGIVTGEKSLGVIGMKERALSLGGSLEIQNATGKGTVVTLMVPVQKL
jgi:PAS domain S-box-containing protein